MVLYLGDAHNFANLVFSACAGLCSTLCIPEGPFLVWSDFFPKLGRWHLALPKAAHRWRQKVWGLTKTAALWHGASSPRASPSNLPEDLRLHEHTEAKRTALTKRGHFQTLFFVCCDSGTWNFRQKVETNLMYVSEFGGKDKRVSATPKNAKSPRRGSKIFVSPDQNRNWNSTLNTAWGGPYSKVNPKMFPFQHLFAKCTILENRPYGRWVAPPCRTAYRRHNTTLPTRTQGRESAVCLPSSP